LNPNKSVKQLTPDDMEEILAVIRSTAKVMVEQKVRARAGGAALEVFVPQDTRAPRARFGRTLKTEQPCTSCKRPSEGGLCDECREELTGSAKVTREKLDSLPYGVIYLDREGKILGFNKEESNVSHLTRQRAIGKNFFTEVAPCEEVKELHGRYDAFMRGEGPAGGFDVTYPFDGGKRTVRVLISFVRVDENRALVIAKKILAGELRDNGTA
jgi:photoactive yellow protein